MARVTAVETFDIRFPTSRELDATRVGDHVFPTGSAWRHPPDA